MTRRQKYNATPTVIDGVRFASKREAKRYGELKILAGAGHITKLEIHPKFPLVIDGRAVRMRSKGFPNGRKVTYTADFRYSQENQTVIEDVKGFDDARGRLRRAIVEALFDVEIRLV